MAERLTLDTIDIDVDAVDGDDDLTVSAAVLVAAAHFDASHASHVSHYSLFRCCFF